MSDRIVSDLVANVWKIVVAEKDVVSAGATLLILESMKMEIPVEADRDGTVSRIAVREGEVVQEGDLLVEIE